MDGGALDRSSILGIFRSLLRQMTAVGCSASDRKCVYGNQNQNCEKRRTHEEKASR